MELFLEFAPAFVASAVLLAFSGFFSASEAALFYLSRRDRRAFEQGNTTQRIAAALLQRPDRLLTAVLFWNLVVNLAYFTIASIIALNLERQDRVAEASWVTAGFLLAIIFFGEMVPKSVAVLHPRPIASAVGVPLAAAVRLLDPLLPLLGRANRLSRRLFLPRFQPEPYLELTDLERAVAMSTSDAELLRQEVDVLAAILDLSQLRVDELMRPRTQVATFRPPVSLRDLKGDVPRSGYVLVTEPNADEIAGAVPITQMFDVPDERLERHSEAVAYVPWSTSVAAALDEMVRGNRRVAVVVSEHGETIGVLTFDDVLDTIFTRESSRSERLLNRQPIREVRPGVWQVTGMTSLRRLAKRFDTPRPPGRTATVAGYFVEQLERFPKPGDECPLGRFDLKVIAAPDRGPLVVEMTEREEEVSREAET